MVPTTVPQRYCSLCGSSTTCLNRGKYPHWHRYEDSYICNKCYSKDYYKKHSDYFKQYAINYIKTHYDKWLKYQREYYRKKK
jgi:hypothetical protein